MARTHHTRVRTEGTGAGGSAAALCQYTPGTAVITAAADNVQDAIIASDAAIAAAVTTADLASVANGEGASLVGIEDSATLYTATDVEAALAEVMVKANAAGGVEGLHLVVAQVGTLGADSLKFTMAIFDSDDAAVLESLPICVDWLFDDFGSGVYAPMVEDAQYKNDASTVTTGAKYINAVGNGVCVSMAYLSDVNGVMAIEVNDNGGLEDRAFIVRAAVLKDGYPTEYRIYGPFTVDVT